MISVQDMRAKLDVFDSRLTGACIRIDLHGCSIPEAKKRVVDVIIESYAKGVIDIIHIITGRGKHINASGTRAALFHSLQEWVQEPEIAPYVKDLKPGVGTYIIVLNKIADIKNRKSPFQIKGQTRNLAKKGDKEAQFVFGKHLFERGNKQCRGWLLKSAEQQHVGAMLLLGYGHALGRNIKYDLKKALYWYKEAAKLGSSKACINLGCMYWSGEAGVTDLDQAIFWFKEADDLGDVMAQRLLGIIYFRLKQYEEAFVWNQKAAALDDPHAQVNLGCMFAEGLGTIKDEKRAFSLFKASAKHGIPEGKMRLGLAYWDGMGTLKNFKEAAKLFLEVGLACDDSVGADCQFFLYCMYRDGQGFVSNTTIANQWLERAAKNKHREACLILTLQKVQEHFKQDNSEKPNTNYLLDEKKEELINQPIKNFEKHTSYCPSFSRFVLLGLGIASVLAVTTHRLISAQYEP